MKISFRDRFAEKLQGRFGKYDFQVGVLVDGPHKIPMERTYGPSDSNIYSNYAGGPIRKKSKTDGPLTIAGVSAANRARLGFNYLTRPFEDGTADVVKFTDAFFRLAFGRSEKKRAENLLQACVRNPILRGEYGKNSESTKLIKGFDRPMIDTAQLFKAIKASCTVRGGGK